LIITEATEASLRCFNLQFTHDLAISRQVKSCPNRDKSSNLGTLSATSFRGRRRPTFFHSLLRGSML